MSLTVNEISLIKRLGNCHENFIRLYKDSESSNTNTTHITDFNTHIHALQRIIMSRSAIRAHPSVFRV